MNEKIKNFLHFLTYDIWRIRKEDVSSKKFSIYIIIKTIFIAVKRFSQDRITNKASALTYSTLLSIVPILAILFAIARGFGFSNLVENRIESAFAGQEEITNYVINFVNSYLLHTKSGIFIGIGLILVFGTVINLTTNIEITFNQIWQIPKQRSIYRKVTDYFSMLIVIPVLLIVTSGFSIFASTTLNDMQEYEILQPIIKFLVQLAPFIVTWFMFTGLYIFMPNTKVKFINALISGIIAGTAYLLFQMLYIQSQMAVSSYNAIYGSFAAFPLFMFWLQVSWTICLFGVEMTYAAQNIKYFNFESDTNKITKRYTDFISILFLSAICKNFEKGEKPFTADELSMKYKTPIRLTNKILYQLQDIELIHESIVDAKVEKAVFLPSMDINKLSVGILLERIDTKGSENFKINKSEFNKEWGALIEARKNYTDKANNILLKDLVS